MPEPEQNPEGTSAQQENLDNFLLTRDKTRRESAKLVGKMCPKSVGKRICESQVCWEVCWEVRWEENNSQADIIYNALCVAEHIDGGYWI